MPIAPLHTQCDGVLTGPAQLAVSNTCAGSTAREAGQSGGWSESVRVLLLRPIAAGVWWLVAA